MYTQRQQKVLKILSGLGLDGLVLNAGPSLTYFSGLHFHLMERPVLLFLLSERKPLIMIPELEKAKLDDSRFELEAVTYPDNPDLWPGIFSTTCGKLGLDDLKIGLESSQLRLLEYRFLVNASPATSFESGDQAIAACRALKDDEEVARMQKAVHIAQNSIKETLPLIKAGITEREVASELIMQLYRQGSEQPLPFSPIVSTGPNGANPHARPTDRKLSRGDLLIIDWGAAWQGYTSDLTRTFAIGDIDAETRRIYELCRRANDAGRAAARPGAAIKTVDDASRSIIVAAGYGPCFTHRTGHGIGMECHEEPYIHDGNVSLLQPGMTFTVEPGIYLKGKNGVRIEDDVLITTDGSRSLSDFSREITFLDN